MILWAIIQSGVYFVPLLGQESAAMCILAWALVLAGMALQLFLARKPSKARWREWILPVLMLVTVMVCEISVLVLLFSPSQSLNPWVGFGMMIVEVFVLYMVTGVVLGIVAHTIKKRVSLQKKNKE